MEIIVPSVLNFVTTFRLESLNCIIIYAKEKPQRTKAGKPFKDGEDIM